ncbi:MAG: pyridoxal-phosphate dependent enzyme, partial [Pseudomonadota bacterium]|nr:pyridoxal-phosphate dependent enzyme [Pseudomonadota bacterium]
MGEAWRSISQADIFAAHRRIAGAVTRTPLIRAHALSDRLGGEIWFKLESLQPTGAFKLRGATNALSQLPAAAKAAGVVCVSTGNHGRGLAHAGRVLGIRVVVCMSSLVPAVKVEGIRKLGAEVRI